MTRYRDVERDIESAFGPHSIFVPSARLGLIVALEHFLSPGDGVVMTSVCCESVVLALYAAGLQPVFVDVDARSGNIDCTTLSRNDNVGARAVLTTNLYGVPDDLPALVDICRRRGWLLIEDCAQAIDSVVGGWRVGTAGVAAVYSFPKFLDEAGGAVVCRDAADAGAIRRRAAGVTRGPKRLSEWARRLQGVLGLNSQSLGGLGGRLRRMRSRIANAAGPQPGEKRRRRLASAGRLLGSGEGPERDVELTRLLGEDRPEFRRYPVGLFVRRLSQKLRELPKLLERMRHENQWLIRECPLSRPPLAGNATACYLAVPFWTQQRDMLRSAIEARMGTRLYYIYDPPLAECLPSGSYVDGRSSPTRDAHWSSHVLPIRGSQGPACVQILRSVSGELSGAE